MTTASRPCSPQQVEPLPKRRKHFRATARVDAGEVLDGPVPVAVAGLDQAVGQPGRAIDAVVEGQHREAVGIGEGVDDARRGAARGHHLPTPHAAGAVEQ